MRAIAFAAHGKSRTGNAISGMRIDRAIKRYWWKRNAIASHMARMRDLEIPNCLPNAQNWKEGTNPARGNR